MRVINPIRLNPVQFGGNFDEEHQQLKKDFSPEALRKRLELMLGIMDEKLSPATMKQGLTHTHTSYEAERQLMSLYIKIVGLLIDRRPARNIEELSGILEKAETLSKRLDTAG